jgi:signal transduction histidine kinase
VLRPQRRRRTEELNRALHELRRPLQALILLEQESGAPAPSASGGARRGFLELSLCALEDLDSLVNGRGAAVTPRRVSCRELILASIERWRPAAGERNLRLYWDAGPAFVEGDPAGVSRALDNILANAIEHGGPPLAVTGARVGGRLRITVANGSQGGARNGVPVPSNDGAGSEAGPEGSPREGRRGQGIPIVSEVARAHGGRFALYRSDEGCVAALELPLAEAAAARAA